MYDDLQYPEIRERACAVVWLLSKDVNGQLYHSQDIADTCKYKEYSRVMEWLGSIICDDWGGPKDLVDIYNEIAQQNVLSLCGTTSHVEEVWNEFCNVVADELSRERQYGKSTPIERGRLSFFQFRDLGFKNKFLAVKRHPLLRRFKPLVVLNKLDSLP